MPQIMDSETRLFGMRIWRRKLSDAEFVDNIRRSVRRAKWHRYFWGLIGIAVVFSVYWAIDQLIGMMAANPPGAAPQVNPLFVFGMAMFLGLMLGLWAGGVIHGSFTMLVEQRKDRLLVVCWDALQLLLAEHSAKEVQDTAEGEPEVQVQ